MEILRVAMIGFGGIGAVHKVAYDDLARAGSPIKLVAVCDKNPDCLKGSIKTNLGSVALGSFDGVEFFTDCDELLRNVEFDVADICLPTFLHKEYTVKLLRAGKHVLCEKPMALSLSDCREMADCAKECGRELAIGQCLRFDAAYLYLKDMIESGELGRLRRITMGALSYMPMWGGWFTDAKKSGGCIFDFHIHDVDIIRYLFGEPEAVSGRGSSSLCAYDTVHTSLFYRDYPVTAVADWTRTGISFCANCSINFEKATVTFDGTTLTVYPKDGGSAEVHTLADYSGYYGEIDYFCDVVSGRCENTKNPAASAALSVKLIDCIRESIDAKGRIVSFSAHD